MTLWFSSVDMPSLNVIRTTLPDYVLNLTNLPLISYVIEWYIPDEHSVPKFLNNMRQATCLKDEVLKFQ